jgi:hypothetical protein
VVLEERNRAGILLRQFVHGQRIDEVLVMDRNLDGGATGFGGERLFYLHDASGTVVGPGANGSIE